VLGVRFHRERIIVALKKKIYIYNFTDLKLIGQISTMNPRGLLALSWQSQGSVLAYPSSGRTGEIALQLPWRVGAGSGGKLRPPLYEEATYVQQLELQAHDTELTQLALSVDGTRLATASVQGTLIRIWDTKTGKQVKEFRRGTDRAAINCINFSKDTKFLCVSSNKGTIHIFALEGETRAEETEGGGRVWSNFLGIGKPLWRWSTAQFHVTDPQSICCFGEDNSVVVVCSDGNFYKYHFDDEKGEAVEQETVCLLNTSQNKKSS